MVIAHVEFEKETLVERLADGRSAKAQLNFTLGIVTQAGVGKCGGKRSVLETLTPGKLRNVVATVKRDAKRAVASRTTAKSIKRWVGRLVDHKTIAAMRSEIAVKGL